MRSHDVLGVRVDDLSEQELVGRLASWLEGNVPRVVVTPNPEFLLAARHDPDFAALLNGSDLSLPDGVGLRFATAALTGDRLRNRHTGVDTLVLLARACAAAGKRLALVGGGPGVAERAADRLRANTPSLRVEGIDPGRVESDRLSDSTTQRLNDYAVIAIGLGQGKQERVMRELASAVPSARILVGVGGAFDMIAGMKRRAPAWMRASGLEWVWRVLIEPTRILRILRAFPVFPAVVVWDTLRRRRFLRACRATIPEIFRQLCGL